jgi:hypothetical protein
VDGEEGVNVARNIDVEESMASGHGGKEHGKEHGGKRSRWEGGKKSECGWNRKERKL